MPATPPTVRRRLLGAELRRAREAASLTLRQAAAQIERTDASLSRIENGLNAIRAIDVLFLLDVYGITDLAKRKALASLAADSRRRGWWQTYSNLLAPEYADLISLEADASLIRSFQMTTVPGLLQTDEYARVVAEAVPPPPTSEEVDAFVRVRMARQEVVTRTADPLRLDVVLSEAALRQKIGGPGVMGAQFERLVESSELPNVTIRVLPYTAGVHPGLGGSFVVLRFRKPAAIEVVLLENMTSSLYLEQEAEIAEYVRAFELLEEQALDPDDSRAMIARMSRDP